MKQTKRSLGSVLKRIPFILLILCPNLIFIPNLPDVIAENWLFKIIPILWVASFISLFFIRTEKNGDYTLIKMAFIGKIVLIPWFAFMGISAFVLFLGGFVIPINWLPLPVFFLLDLFMLAITSFYASFGIYGFYPRNQMPLKILLIVLQWFFVADVISSSIAFMQSKRKNKNTP